MTDSTTVARLACDEATARSLAAALGEIIDAESAICGAFEADGGRWQVAVHFRKMPDEAAVRALVALAADEKTAAALTFEQVASADWVAQSLAGLPPVRAGRFVVHGAHDRAEVPVNARGIEIEAALAFGTGHHGTTRGCLLALDGLLKRRPPHSRRTGNKIRGRAMRILDVGTGSGVLAIAAAEAMRTPVVASDIDIRAVDAARANARLNHVGPFVTLTRAAGVNAAKIRRGRPYDIVFANILLGPLVRLAVPLARLTAPRSRIVLSGLLPAHANTMLAIFRAQGLTLERRILLEGWVTLVLRRGR